MLIKKWMMLLSVFLTSWLSANQSFENGPSHYLINKTDYTFSTVFDMTHDKQAMGSVIKSVFHVATHYDLYDRFGLYEGEGVCRLFSLGLLYAWGTEIDLYDVDGHVIGFIDGEFATMEPAKFNFYDAKGTRIAIAYLDQSCTSFSIVDPDNSAFVLARLTHNFVENMFNNWDIVIYYPGQLPSFLIKVFSAFVCDMQDKFKLNL